MNIFEIVIVQPIFNLLMGLYALIPGHDFGVAIILFTIIVRTFLYPLTKSMLHQSKTMRRLQPQLVKIKKNAKGNRQVEAMQMMELYKKYGVSPFRSIGILLIQLPVFIALYYVIQIFTSERSKIPEFTYNTLEKFSVIGDVVRNPSLFNEKLFGFIDLTQPAISSEGISLVLILFALIAGYTQYVMSKQTMPTGDTSRGLRQIMAEAAEGKQADQSEMNAIVMRKMSKILPLFMVFITVTLPGALALYFAVSNGVAVAQQSYLLRQDEEELEELAERHEPAPLRAKKNTSSNKHPKQKKPTKVSSETVVRIVAKDGNKRKGT